MRNISTSTLSWAKYDDRSFQVGGRTMTPNETAIQLRSEYERDVGVMDELRDAIAVRKIVSRPLDEAEQRDWVRRAVQDGVRYGFAPATLAITALKPDVPYGPKADVTRDQRGADRVREADHAAIVESAAATVAAVKANSKRTASK